MKFRKLYHKRTIRANILIVFMAIMISSIFFFTVLYMASTTTIRRTLIDKMDNQAEVYLSVIDNNFKNTETMLYNMLSDRKLVFLVDYTNLLNDYELRDALLSEQERIMLVKESNIFVSNAVIFLPGIGMKISDSYIEKMARKDYEEVQKRYMFSGSGINYQDGSLFMASSGALAYELQEMPVVLFLVGFEQAKLTDAMGDFNASAKSGSFFYEESTDFFLDSCSSNNISTEILNQIKPLLNEDNFFPESIKIKGEKYQLSISKSDYLGFFVQYAPEKEILKNLRGYKWALFFYLVVSAVAALLFARHIERIVHKPLGQLMEAFAGVKKETIEKGGTQYVGEDEFSYLFDGFNLMQDNTKILVGELVRQKTLTQEAELKHLQAQINPHFLYNSFYSLRAKIHREDLESAERLASLLGSYFRFLTRDGENEVSLLSEVEHAENYAQIQYMRFHDRMEFTFEELPEEYREILVPRLILQPLVENALKYALEERERDGILKVTFVPDKNRNILEIRVEDNGKSDDDTAVESVITTVRERLVSGKESTGLVNIHRRLILYFGEESGLEVGKSLLGGILVTVYIPSEIID